MTGQEKKEKLIWMEHLRIVAAFAVVLLHVASVRVKTKAILYEDCYVWLSFYHTVTRFAVNCFIMISGALLLRPEKEISISAVVKKHLPKLAFMFVFWSAIYVLEDIYQKHLTGKTLNLHDILEQLIYGHYHLWYLYMLAGLYLVLPLLKVIANDKKLIEYMLTLGAVTWLLPNTLQIVPKVNEFLQTIVGSKMMMYLPKGYSFYLLLGFYLTHYEIKPWMKRVIYIGGSIGIVYGIVGGIYFSRLAGATTQVPYNNGTINIFLYSAAVFLYFSSIRAKKPYSERMGKCITWLGSCTLGVYLAHPLFVDVFASKAMEWLNYKYLAVALPALAALFFLGALLLTAVLKKLPFLGKHIV